MSIPKGLTPQELRDEARNGVLVPRSEVREGENYIFRWNPYSWAWDENQPRGYDAVVRVEVVDIGPMSGDIKMELTDGRTLSDLGEGRRQVMGRAEFHSDVPDWTDVGMGGRFYVPEDDPRADQF